MPMSRTLLLTLLIPFLALSGCGGSGGESGTAPPAPTTSIGIKVSPSTTITTDESGLGATRSISLGSQPTADVTIPVTSSDTTEGTTNVAQLVFTTTNWATAQTVTVTGVNDDSNDGNQSYTIHLGPAQSTDLSYKNLQQTISAINLDVRTGYVDVPPLTFISGYTTDESGGQVTFQVKLHTKPNYKVTIPVSSSDEGEGTVIPSQLIFTASDWSAPQTVTVTGVEDPIAADNPSYTIRLGLTESDDDIYNGLDPTDIGLTNADVKTGSVLVSPLPLTTSEDGITKDDFQVRLGTEPFYDVTIPITSLDTSEGWVDQDSLTFTSGNWNEDQTVTVTGVSDNLADGDIPYTIQLGTTTSDDDNYSDLNPADVSVTNQDVRSADFVVSTISGNTHELGGQATFTVKLASQPTHNVEIPVSSDNTDEGTVIPSKLVFSNSDWNTPQTVTVTGVGDNVYDNNTSYHIVLAAAVSDDTLYSGQNPDDVTVLNEDRKNGSVSVSAISGNTDESGVEATFTVSLNHQPAGDVTIAISSSMISEGTVSSAILTLTPAQWSKTVTVKGVDDTIADGNQTFLINLSTTSSPNDNNFAGLTPSPNSVSVTNVDLVAPYGVEPRISAGAAHSLILASDGTVWGWGACSNGQLDAVTPATCSGNFTLPQRLNISGASAVSAGDSFSVIAKADGTVSTSGKNTSYQLGRLANASSLTPVDGLTNVKTVSAGGAHVLALKNDGSVWAWGNGLSGQLGNGGTTNSWTPVQSTGALVGPGKTVTAIAAGFDHSLALLADGANRYVCSWGSDLEYQLGLEPGNMTTPTPTAIPLLTEVSAIAAGRWYSLAVGKYSGASDTWGWGANTNFQLGTTSGNKTVPTAVNTFSNTLIPTRLDGGNEHSIAMAPVSGVNKVYAWGDNDDASVEPLATDTWDNRGALGTTTITDLTLPTLSFTNIPTTAAATDVNAGSTYSLVLLGDGRIQASGLNNFAQLGTNEITTSSYTATPKDVEDPGDPGPGTISPAYSFYAYRPIISGQPATSTTVTSTTLTVCADTLAAPANCGPITHYKYSTNNETGNGSWYGPYPITQTFTVSSLTGSVNVWVKGMTSTTNEIQTNTSAAKVSWTVN